MDDALVNEVIDLGAFFALKSVSLKALIYLFWYLNVFLRLKNDYVLKMRHSGDQIPALER